jgi:RNA polymerase sigma-70 factor (ECF subfamily)
MERTRRETIRAVETHIPALRRFARALLRGDGERADDLVQDCIERALCHWHKRRPDRDLRGWLFTILYNRFITEQFRRRREGHCSLDDLAEAQLPGCDGAQERTLALRDLRRGLALLPQDQQAVLLLVGIEDSSYGEAARILGVPIGTVMSRLSRGRERLRRYMTDGPPMVHGSARPDANTGRLPRVAGREVPRRNAPPPRDLTADAVFAATGGLFVGAR